MADLTIPICNDVKNLEVKTYAKSKFVACPVALAALVTLFTWILFQNGDDHSLKRLCERSVAQEYPRLIIHPWPPNDTESSLIWYRSYDPNSYKVWVEELQRFIAENIIKMNESINLTKKISKNRNYSLCHNAPNTEVTCDKYQVYRHAVQENLYSCDFDYPPGKGRACHVDVTWLSRTIDENFYYYRAAPWIIINLSNLYSWRPDFYNDTNKLPNKMSADLKEYIIQKRPAKRLNTVWVSCEGENVADRENIGPLNYYPARGFSGYFYPYENIAGYLSPLVLVQFERPAIGVLINIECKAWAKNLHNGENQVGTLHFELMID